jgi:hypothetical protein
MPNKWRLANYSFEPEVADAMRAAYRMVCAAPHFKDIGGAFAEKIVGLAATARPTRAVFTRARYVNSRISSQFSLSARLRAAGTDG